MRLLTPWFVRQWDGRLLNIHPALLPAFKGLDTHARALAAGAKEHGATVHFVVPEMDSGPIIAQAAVPVRAGDTEATLAARVLEVEHRIYPQALRLVAEGRVQIADGRCLIDGQAVVDRSRIAISPAGNGRNAARQNITRRPISCGLTGTARKIMVCNRLVAVDTLRGNFATIPFGTTRCRIRGWLQSGGSTACVRSVEMCTDSSALSPDDSLLHRVSRLRALPPDLGRAFGAAVLLATAWTGPWSASPAPRDNTFGARSRPQRSSLQPGHACSTSAASSCSGSTPLSCRSARPPAPPTTRRAAAPDAGPPSSVTAPGSKATACDRTPMRATTFTGRHAARPTAAWPASASPSRRASTVGISVDQSQYQRRRDRCCADAGASISPRSARSPHTRTAPGISAPRWSAASAMCTAAASTSAARRRPSYHARLWAAMAELSYYWALPDNSRLVPKLTFDWTRTRTDAFAETGGATSDRGLVRHRQPRAHADRRRGWA